MQIDTTIPTYCSGDQLVPAEAIRTWARRAERAGIECLWAIDHLVNPPTYRTSVLDPLVVFAHAASVTDGMDFGTSVLLLPLRRTATVASQVATLQHLIDGDLTLGVGAGYVDKEFEAAGVPKAERGPRLNEGIEVLQALFAGESSYDGQFHTFDGVQIDPIPEEPPRILAGGNSNVADGERTIPEPIIDRILRAGGWIAPPSHPERLDKEWSLIARRVSDRGVDPDSLTRVVLNYVHLVEGTPETTTAEQRAAFEDLFSPSRGFEHAAEHCLTGTIDEVVEQLKRYEEIGFDRAIAGSVAHDPDVLDGQIALFADRVLPAFG
ncbi:LLM class flavin-dependent oxidoreductase [Halorussus sp. AFM4]|uniref:LLM class flavin-dependent oxidoreductase n=1 Tax=Halorussus sp. AFM4 TaxID=3421651 RepID=UPI003EBE6220